MRDPTRSSGGSILHRVLFAATLAIAAWATPSQALQRQPIDRADQLPVHSYPVAKAPSVLLQDEPALAVMFDSLREDLEADLAAYDLRDVATLRSYYRALSKVAMLRHRPDTAIDYEARAGSLEEKPAARILSGWLLRPLVAAEKAGGSGAGTAFSAAMAVELTRLPYDSVQAELKTYRAGLETLSRGFLEGVAATTIDPAAANGRVSKDLAIQLVNLCFSLRSVLPYRDEVVRQLSALIDAHRVEKPDIWAARDVSLDGRPGLRPVVVAISDGGVDPSRFPGRLWTNPKEVPGNRKDDDHNGYADDVHGIAWTWDGRPKTGDLRPPELSPADLQRGRENMKGFLDMQAGLDSPEARELRRRFASMSKEEVKPLYEGLIFYTVYAHGTHVAGIAIRGNPAARVLVARIDFPHRPVRPAPTQGWASGFSRAMERSIDYFRKAGARVVNMSWGFSAADLEHDLEMNGVGAAQEERRQLALRYFNEVKKVFGAAIASAPEILFVVAAGNSNQSNQFTETIPASFDLPNTITVGAVDRAGDEAAFTSFGKVDLYANGYEVESVLPDRGEQRWSGTSMASPQVVNLAAKLFAVDPRLSAAEAKRLIVDGAERKDVSAGRSIRLLNEARSFELARERRQ